MKNSTIDQFDVNLLSVKKDTEIFNFQVDDLFFDNFDQDIIKKGALDVKLVLHKTNLIFKMTFYISGTVNLICDKSLEAFDENINSENEIFFKYGDENIELDLNVFQIENNTININIASHILEFILLEIPFRKIHPSLRDEDDNEEGKVLYQTKSDQNTEEQADPDWKGLEDLKNKFNK